MRGRSRRSPVPPLWAAVLAATVAGVWAAFRTTRGRRASLRGQVAIVTGGARGLGLFVAYELARAGCKLAICARDPDELDQARHDLAEAHPDSDVLAVPCDPGEPGDVDRVVSETIARFGRIDILVNNGASHATAPPGSLPSPVLHDFEAEMAAGFWGTVHATLAVLPHMRARRAGRIVNITSVGGDATPQLLARDCARLAAAGFSEGMRAELVPDGVSVTTVTPGPARPASTDLIERPEGDEHERRWLGILAQLSGVSVTPRAAARQIVASARRREAETVLGLSSKVQLLARGLFPGLILRLFGPRASDLKTRSR